MKWRSGNCSPDPHTLAVLAPGARCIMRWRCKAVSGRADAKAAPSTTRSTRSSAVTRPGRPSPAAPSCFPASSPRPVQAVDHDIRGFRKGADMRLSNDKSKTISWGHCSLVTIMWASQYVNQLFRRLPLKTKSPLASTSIMAGSRCTGYACVTGFSK